MRSIIIALLTLVPLISIYSSPLNFTGALGAGFPFSDYADTDTDNSNASYATPGLTAQLTLGYEFSESFHLRTGWFANINPVDLNSLLDQASAEFPTLDWEAEATGYSQNQFLIGPVFETNTGDLNARLYVMGGLGLFTFPSLSLTASNSVGDSVTTETSGASSAALSLRTGIELGHQFERIEVFAGVGLSWTQYDINDLEYKTTLNGTLFDSYTEELTIPVQTIDVVIGIATNWWG